MSAAPPRVVYVTSRGHSGSTLTEMLLAGHPQLVALGELRQLGTERQEPCRCGGGELPSCWYWQRVDELLVQRLGLGVDRIEIDADDDQTFVLHNRAIVAACLEVSGASVAIDSSKTLDRLERLVALDVFDLHVLHLVRSPYGVVYSNLKRGRDWVGHARNYTFAAMRTRRFLDGLDPRVPRSELRYEKLVKAPEDQLRRLLAPIGFEFDPVQLDWATHDVHTFAGNPMRTTRDSTIRPDTAWRRGLGPRRILGVTWWTLPTRFAGTHFYDEHRPYWKGEGVDAWREFRNKKLVKRRKERRRRWRRNPWLKKPYDLAKRAWRFVFSAA